MRSPDICFFMTLPAKKKTHLRVQVHNVVFLPGVGLQVEQPVRVGGVLAASPPAVGAALHAQARVVFVRQIVLSINTSGKRERAGGRVDRRTGTLTQGTGRQEAETTRALCQLVD